MKDAVPQKEATQKRKWGYMALGVMSGIMLGLPLLAYSGIRKLSGNKLPKIHSDIKRGTAIGMAVAVSVVGVVFSGGFAAPTVPAIVAGMLTCAAGVGGVVIVDKNIEKQRQSIQALEDKLDKQQTVGVRDTQVNKSVGKDKTMQRSASNNVQPRKRPRSRDGSVANIVALETSKVSVGSAEGEPTPSDTQVNISVGKDKTMQRSTINNAQPRKRPRSRAGSVANMVALETSRASVGSTEGELTPSNLRSSKRVKLSKTDPER